MFTTDASLAAVLVGSIGLLWAAAYTALGRLTPADQVPTVLHGRIQRTRSAVPVVAVIGLLLLAAGVAASI